MAVEDISPTYPYSTIVITQQVLVFLLQLQQMILVNPDFLGSQGVIQRAKDSWAHKKPVSPVMIQTKIWPVSSRTDK